MDEDQKKCGGISAIGLVAILVSLTCIIVGAMNIDFSEEISAQNVASTCSIETRIPFYLIIAGVINIVLIVLRLVFQRCCRNCGQGEDSKFCSSLGFLASFSCITIYDLLALAATLVWLCVGSAWIFSAYDDVDYNNTSSANYCPEFLYRFSFWICIMGWIFVTLAFVFGLLAKFCTCFYNILCCKPCKAAEANQV